MYTMKLSGTTVFITGGAGVIGSAFARSLVPQGANVCIADLDEAKGQGLASDLHMDFGMLNPSVIFLKCDVTDEENFKNAFEGAVRRYGHVDVMVNIAGVRDETSWERMLDINLAAPDIGEQSIRFACVCPETTDTPTLTLKPHQIRDGYLGYVRNLNYGGKISPHTVADALRSLIADDDSNNTFLQVTLQEGIVKKKITVQDV